MPIYNDWDSAFQTILELNKLEIAYKITLVLVDDGSDEKDSKNKCIKNLMARVNALRLNIRILTSPINYGNQIAIMRGLEYVFQSASPVDVIAVMDADGEDRPAFLPRLLGFLDSDSIDVVVAKRGSRHQTLGFFLMHNIFKQFFRILTSKKIDFGNFMVFRHPILKKILNYAKSGGNSLPGLILRTSNQIQRVRVDRGKRYFGNSRTNSDNLVIWGMEAIAPFAKQIVARILKTSIIVSSLTMLAGAILFTIRISTELLIPGSASTLLMLLLVFLVLLIFISSVTVLQFSKLEALERRILESHLIDQQLEVMFVGSRK
jgi:glycosyltransferase involved in cell wall biosynthesis